jgi:hypothetical protein
MTIPEYRAVPRQPVPPPGYYPPPAQPQHMARPGYYSPPPQPQNTAPPGYYSPPPQPQNTAPPWTTTKTMSLYSLLLGGMSFLLDFFFGMGIVLAVIGGVLGLLAFNRAKKYNEPKGMALAAVIVSGCSIALWLIVVVGFMALLGAGSS